MESVLQSLSDCCIQNSSLKCGLKDRQPSKVRVQKIITYHCTVIHLQHIPSQGRPENKDTSTQSVRHRKQTQLFKHFKKKNDTERAINKKKQKNIATYLQDYCKSHTISQC